MDSIISDLKRNFKQGSIALQFIYVNVGIFLVTSFFTIILQLFNRTLVGWLQLLELPASIAQFLLKPWTLFSYMFLHAGLIHLLFNMLWLYWFGQLFLQFFSTKHLRGLYLLGGIFGGVCYMLAYNIFPYFEPMIQASYLVGASASVIAIAVATACQQPNYEIRLFLFGSLRLKYLALVLVLSDLLFITSGNAGGHIAHLGGALAGFLFAKTLSRGTDVTRWINVVLDAPALFSERQKKRQRKPRMTVSQGKHEADYEYNVRKKQQSDEVDRILEKLKKSGYESLSTTEKQRLFDASNR